MLQFKKMSGRSKYLFLFVLLFSFSGLFETRACDISFDVVDNVKEVYEEGDILVVKVKILFTHRVCPEGIKATKFTYDGMKILGATQWKETRVGTYERKLKIEITKPDKGLKLNAVRTCDKDGGSGSISFNADK
ncbi:hypothetical protein E9993_10775 [Labilibacter sediminis]|nr:hypothetical protein E9993_10775 [Labilibacter sediminis]